MRFEVAMAITILLPYCFITWAVYFLSRNPADAPRRAWSDLVKSALWPIGAGVVVTIVIQHVLHQRRATLAGGAVCRTRAGADA